jgi:hypothetical protein
VEGAQSRKVGIEELVPLEPNYTPTSDHPPMFIFDLFSSLFGSRVEKSVIKSASIRLEAAIMPSSNQLPIPIFWARHVWKHKNPGPGWLWILCLKRTYNKDGEVRDTFVVRGGYSAMAR